MKISEFSVKNYQFTLIIFILVLALGLSSLFNMPRGEDPEFEAPTFNIIVVYPGTSPADMEDLVVDKMEKRYNELEDIKRITTNIEDGLAVIRVDFKYETNPDDKYQEIVRETNALKSELPQDIYKMEIKKFTPTDVNIIQLAIISETAPYHEMEEQAEKLVEQLEAVKSLKNVDSWGYPERVVRISLNIDKMGKQGIPVNRVINALQSENTNIPAGSVQVGSRQFNVKTSGDYESLEEIRNTIVYSSGSKIIYLKDVADVDFNYEEEKYITRLNGKRAVLVTASQKADQNIFKVGETTKPIIEKFKSQLPGHITLEHNFDQADSVSKRLGRFAKDFAIAILLVSITLLPLGFRAAVVVMISIPLSLSIGLSLLDWLGFTINQLSIVGLIVALGILVDDSIVVVENIERYLRMGYTKKNAAIVASKQIGLAVIGCTATLIFAFLPLLFLPEGAGDFIRSLPMAVVATVLASLFVSLTIVPFLSSRILSNHESPEGNIFMRGLKKIISGSYSKLLNKALNRPVTSLLVALGIFAGALALIPVVGFSLFPASEKPQFLINIEMPNGTSIYETDKVARYVETELEKYNQIKYMTTNVGKGNPRVYYNIIQRGEAPNFSQFFVQLEDMKPAEKVVLIDQLRDKFKYYPNAKIEVKDFEQGPAQDAPVAIRVFGDNLDTLRVLADKVETMLKATDGTIYVNNALANQRTDFKIRVNKEKAGMLGIPVMEINRTVRLAIAGLNVGTFSNAEGDDYTINVTIPKGKNADLNTLKDIYVTSLTGTSIPLSQVADVEMEKSTNIIRHYDKNRYAIITAFVKNGYLTNDINSLMIQKLDAMKFPKGYSYMMAGEIESRNESFGGIGVIILITAFGFLGILILEFKTFKSSLIVLSVIPLGIIGAILMLLATGYTFSFTATIGLIALVGIEVKNSILLVDFTNQLREEGMELNKAIQEAGEIRFVPIVLTSLTAIGGLIPLAIEGNPLYSPLAIVLIGGLISSTLLSRIVTPVLYKILPPAIEVKKEKELATA